MPCLGDEEASLRLLVLPLIGFVLEVGDGLEVASVVLCTAAEVWLGVGVPLRAGSAVLSVVVGDPQIFYKRI